MKKTLQAAYQSAYEQMEKRAKQNKLRYDASAHAADLEPGDRVLVKKLGARVASKVADRWERDVYVVLKRREGLPVYTVKPEKSDGPIRTLHRNVLLPIGMLSDESTADRNVACRKKESQVPESRNEEVLYTDTEPDEEAIEVVVTRQPNRPLDSFGATWQ